MCVVCVVGVEVLLLLIVKSCCGLWCYLVVCEDLDKCVMCWYVVICGQFW